MLPSLSKLSIRGKNEGYSSTKRQKTDNRVELIVTESVDRIVYQSGQVFNVACVSAAEMTVAKVVLDALLQERVVVMRKGKNEFQELPFHKRLLRGHKEHLREIFFEIGLFEDNLKKRLDIATDDAIDIKKCIEIIDLLRPSTVSPLKGNSEDAGVEEVSSRYKQFLFHYAEERGLSTTQLLHMDDDDDDADDDKEDRYGGVYRVGVNSVLSEYFTRPYYYATSKQFSHVLRSFATSPKNGRLVCVGIIMMTLRDHHVGLMRSRDYRVEEKRPMRIQGIVGCSIFKYFYHAPVGSALLGYVQGVALREGNYVAVDPLKDNEAWEQKLRAAENVVIGIHVKAGGCVGVGPV